MPMIARIYVGLKPGVLDPQGRTIAASLNDLGFDEVQDATQGKIIELKLADGEPAAVEARIKDMCERLLTNTVIESYRIELDQEET